MNKVVYQFFEQIIKESCPGADDMLIQLTFQYMNKEKSIVSCWTFWESENENLVYSGIEMSSDIFSVLKNHLPVEYSARELKWALATPGIENAKILLNSFYNEARRRKLNLLI